MRILAIGGHIGDMELSCGAVLAKHARLGDEVYILSTTVGERGCRYPEKIAEYKKQKIEEGLRCAQKLGAVESRHLDYPDTELPCTREVQIEICEEIRRIRPDIVITHWKKATHTDHYNTAINVEKAVWFAKLPTIVTEHPSHSVKKIFYTDNWEDPIDFVPNVFVSFEEEDMERWQAAIYEFAAGRGEVVSFRFNKFYEHYSYVRGMVAGFAHAQAFYSELIIKTDKLFAACNCE